MHNYTIKIQWPVKNNCHLEHTFDNTLLNRSKSLRYSTQKKPWLFQPTKFTYCQRVPTGSSYWELFDNGMLGIDEGGAYIYAIERLPGWITTFIESPHPCTLNYHIHWIIKFNESPHIQCISEFNEPSFKNANLETFVVSENSQFWAVLRKSLWTKQRWNLK